MRMPNNGLIAGLAFVLAGCSSGTVITRQPPAPRPVPVVVVEPLEIDIARPHNGKLFVQTNRAAYVAIFEIVPERGVTLVYPVSARQRRFVVAGLRDVPVWWEGSRVEYHASGMPSPRSRHERYIYAIASDVPLRISDAAFQDRYLHDVLGSRVYRSANPYATMRALAREFVPSVGDEEWAEDAYALSRSYATERYRVTRVYCRDGSMYEVPAELADRVWCPPVRRQAVYGSGRVSEVDVPVSRASLMRPDSVVGDNGRRVATRARGSNGRGPIDRVKEPVESENRGNGRNDDDDDRPGNGRARDRQDVASEDHPRPPNDRPNDDATAKPRGAEVKEAKPMPPRPRPLPQSVTKPMKVESSDSATKSETQAKPDTAAQTKSDSTAGSKSQAPDEKRAKPAKRRGQADSARP